VFRTGTTGELLFGMCRMATVLAVKIPSNCLARKYCFAYQRPTEKNNEESSKKTSSTKNITNQKAHQITIGCFAT
jgi:hypothetical protein